LQSQSAFTFQVNQRINPSLRQSIENCELVAAFCFVDAVHTLLICSQTLNPFPAFAFD
jgi:hypothetical protein